MLTRLLFKKGRAISNIEKGNRVMTLINVFTVEPEKQQKSKGLRRHYGFLREADAYAANTISSVFR
jgi:hypothetical protein